MSIKMQASIRTNLGKGASRRLRKNNLVPAIVYGGAVAELNVELQHNVLLDMFEKGTNIYNETIMLGVDDKQEEVVIKDIQRHPYRRVIMHMDFLRIDKTRVIKKKIPLKFTGKEISNAVKLGAIMTFFQKKVEVRCLPQHLPNLIEVDVSNMQTSTTIRLSDLKLPKGVEITALLHNNSDYDQAVVGIGKHKAT